MPKIHQVDKPQTFEKIALIHPKDVKGDYQAYLQRQEMYLQQRVNNFLEAHPNLLIDSRKLYQEFDSELSCNCLFLKVVYRDSN